jgi:hypothetical protein
MVLKTFRRNRKEVAGGWRTLHNEEFHNLYASPNIISVVKSKEDVMGSSCRTNGREMINLYKVLVEKPEGKRSLGRPKRRWMIFRTDLKGIFCEGVNLIHVP